MGRYGGQLAPRRFETMGSNNRIVRFCGVLQAWQGEMVKQRRALGATALIATYNYVANGALAKRTKDLEGTVEESKEEIKLLDGRVADLNDNLKAHEHLIKCKRWS